MIRNSYLCLISLLLLMSCGGSSGEDGAKVGEACGAEQQCGAPLFCKYPAGDCGESGALGVCTQAPEACTAIYAPVCGCDGQTYASDCVAAGSRQSVRREGEC